MNDTYWTVNHFKDNWKVQISPRHNAVRTKYLIDLIVENWKYIQKEETQLLLTKLIEKSIKKAISL